MGGKECGERLKSVQSNRGRDKGQKVSIRMSNCTNGVVRSRGMGYGDGRRKVNVLEMKCWRSLVGVLRIDRVRNEEVRRRAGIERELASREDPSVLRWFGHVEKSGEYSMARMVLLEKVSGGRVRGRLEVRLDGWCEGGLKQHRNNSGGCARMRGRSERVESSATYVTE